MLENLDREKIKNIIDSNTSKLTEKGIVLETGTIHQINDITKNHTGFELFHPAYIQRYFKNTDSNILKLNNDPIAFTLWGIDTNNQAELVFVHVHPHVREKGIAKLMINNAILDMVEKGNNEVNINVGDQSGAIVKIISSLGFICTNNFKENTVTPWKKIIPTSELEIFKNQLMYEIIASQNKLIKSL